jgi:hypothetical protein
MLSDDGGSIYYLLNLSNAFFELFVMMEENRYNDRLEWDQLYRIRASRNVESWNAPHLVK